MIPTNFNKAFAFRSCVALGTVDINRTATAIELIGKWPNERKKS